MQVVFKSAQKLGNKSFKAGAQVVSDSLAGNQKFKALVKSGEIVVQARDANAQSIQALKDQRNARKAEIARKLSPQHAPKAVLGTGEGQVMFDVALFRKAFPEFADTARYPEAMICFWAELGECQVRERRWREQTCKGISLYVAHEITLASQNYKAGNIGGVPGSVSGPANSKTVGSVTVAYDTQQTAEKDAGYWNLTIYGKQFIHLARIFGAGCVQLA